MRKQRRRRKRRVRRRRRKERERIFKEALKMQEGAHELRNAGSFYKSEKARK